MKLFQRGQGSKDRKRPRWIILSPHLDDAALSVGGLIASLKSVARVEIWSLFCGAALIGPYSELASWLHASSGGSTGSRLQAKRELEDGRACKHLGAFARHFGWKDSPYRKDAGGGFMYQTTQRDHWHDGDNRLVAEMAMRLSNMTHQGDVVLAPLGIGKHVDHVITRNVAERLAAPTLMYYPEVPYLQLFPAHVGTAIRGLCPVSYSLGRDEIVTWIGSLQFYVSQMEMLEHAAGKMPELIVKYATEPLALYRDCSSDRFDLTAYRVFA